jgi:SnoaL-like domain
MDASTEELLDREQIRDCIARLARGEDRRDAELIRASFWPDAVVDLGVFSGSFDEYLAFVVPGSPAITVTQHMLGQSMIERSGDTALVETYVTAYHRMANEDGDRDTVIGGRYLDRMDKRGSQWVSGTARCSTTGIRISAFRSTGRRG